MLPVGAARLCMLSSILTAFNTVKRLPALAGAVVGVLWNQNGLCILISDLKVQ